MTGNVGKTEVGDLQGFPHTGTELLHLTSLPTQALSVELVQGFVKQQIDLQQHLTQPASLQTAQTDTPKATTTGILNEAMQGFPVDLRLLEGLSGEHHMKKKPEKEARVMLHVQPERPPDLTTETEWQYVHTRSAIQPEYVSQGESEGSCLTAKGNIQSEECFTSTAASESSFTLKSNDTNHSIQTLEYDSADICLNSSQSVMPIDPDTGQILDLQSGTVFPFKTSALPLIGLHQALPILPVQSLQADKQNISSPEQPLPQACADKHTQQLKPVTSPEQPLQPQPSVKKQSAQSETSDHPRSSITTSTICKETVSTK